MKLINRPQYIERLKQLRGTPDIKIMTGVRRCGKSELLKAFAGYIKSDNPDANIIRVDFNSLEFDNLREYHLLHKYVTDRHVPGCENVVMIDEVQMCENFELAVNSLHSSFDYDIYLTGSNAFLQSSDLATLFTGRFIPIHVFPFSFKEFCAYFDTDHDLPHLLQRYILEGGLAGSYYYNNITDKVNYLKEVYRTIIIRDLITKFNLSPDSSLYRVGEFMMDNAGNLTSPNAIEGGLNADKVSISRVTVSNYLDYLSSAFLLYKSTRYDVKGKSYLRTLNKYYNVDTGLRYALLGTRNMDWGRMLENIVYLELLRRGFDVYVGKLYQKEIDFVATRQSEKIYIQVCDYISDPSTFEREISPLRQIRDAYPKMILARTNLPAYDRDGIIINDIAAWLLAD